MDKIAFYTRGQSVGFCQKGGAEIDCLFRVCSFEFAYDWFLQPPAWRASRKALSWRVGLLGSFRSKLID